MREIKFRVWFPKQKQMSEVKYLHWDKKNIHGDYLCNYVHQSIANWVLMQYIGLKDKKRTPEYPEGQEIYEGDILRVSNHFPGGNVHTRQIEVRWAEWTPYYPHINMNKYDEYEVIGNVFENPELLEAIR